jgi:hypothetical protein
MNRIKLLTIIVFVLVLLSCTSEADNHERFTITHTQHENGAVNFISIIKDNHTQIEYIYVQGYKSGGLTRLDN